MHIAVTQKQTESTVYTILFAISFLHLLNDTFQSVIPAIFPILKVSMNLTNFQLGLISFALNMTSSMMQPVVGLYSDRKPKPNLLPIGMCFTLIGMIGLAFAPSLFFVIISVIFVGLGSAAFHPEGSKVTHLAAGGRKGLAQSIYQVGGNFGQSLASLLTVLIFVPFGQFGAIYFTFIVFIAILVAKWIANWYKSQLTHIKRVQKNKTSTNYVSPYFRKIYIALTILVLFVFIRSWYSAAITNFFPIYVIEEYNVSIPISQLYIFIFSVAGVLGTFFGGPIAERLGKKNVLFFSMFGSAPLALIVPHLQGIWLYPVLFFIGIIILSSFSVTVVYAQELLPGRVGFVSGLIVGLAFGMGALGAVAIGGLSDLFGLKPVMIAAGFLPLFGILSFFLPSDKTIQKWYEKTDESLH